MKNWRGRKVVKKINAIRSSPYIGSVKSFPSHQSLLQKFVTINSTSNIGHRLYPRRNRQKTLRRWGGSPYDERIFCDLFRDKKSIRSARNGDWWSVGGHVLNEVFSYNACSVFSPSVSALSQDRPSFWSTEFFSSLTRSNNLEQNAHAERKSTRSLLKINCSTFTVQLWFAYHEKICAAAPPPPGKPYRHLYKNFPKTAY